MVEKLQAEVDNLKEKVEQTTSSSSQSEALLREEVERLLKQIADLKAKAEADLDDCRTQLTEEKARELGQQTEKHQCDMQSAKLAAEANLKAVTEELQADLATARQGFDAEQQALEKRREDMVAEYER